MRRHLTTAVVALATVGMLVLNTPAATAAHAARKAVDPAAKCASSDADVTSYPMTRTTEVGPDLDAAVEVKKAGQRLWCMRIETLSDITGWSYSATVTAELVSHTSYWVFDSFTPDSAWTPVLTRHEVTFAGDIELSKKSKGTKRVAKYAFLPSTGVA